VFVWWSGMHPILSLFFLVAGVIWLFQMMFGGWRSRDWEDVSSPGNHPQDRDAQEPDGWRCEQPQCQSKNPAHGRFCRMCGVRRPARRVFIDD
jgi:hypothetical protein